MRVWVSRKAVVMGTETGMGMGMEWCMKDKKPWKKSQRFRSGRSDTARGTQELGNSTQYRIQVSHRTLPNH